MELTKEDIREVEIEILVEHISNVKMLIKHTRESIEYRSKYVFGYENKVEGLLFYEGATARLRELQRIERVLIEKLKWI